MNDRDTKADSERLDWLLNLIWDTGRCDQDSLDSMKTLKKLRRKLHDACFPFRDALDEARRGADL